MAKTNIAADLDDNFFTRTRVNADKKLMRRLDLVCDTDQPFKELKREFGITMRDICAITGGSYSTIQNWNLNERRPSKWILRCVIECAVMNRRHDCP